MVNKIILSKISATFASLLRRLSSFAFNAPGSCFLFFLARAEHLTPAHHDVMLLSPLSQVPALTCHLEEKGRAKVEAGGGRPRQGGRHGQAGQPGAELQHRSEGGQQ